MVRFLEVPDGGLPYADLYLFLVTADGQSEMFKYKPTQLINRYDAAYELGIARVGFVEHINDVVAWAIAKESDTEHCDYAWLKAILQQFIIPYYEDKDNKEVAIFMAGELNKYEKKAFEFLNLKENFNFDVYILGV